MNEQLEWKDFICFRASQGHNIKRVELLLNNKTIDSFFDSGCTTDITSSESVDKLEVGKTRCTTKVEVLEGMVELTHKTTPVLLTLGKGLNAISCYISPLIGHVGGCGLLVGTETMKKLGV
eukprot:Nk52_evm1s1899 gene=Nk52_evmTU1s1899